MKEGIKIDKEDEILKALNDILEELKKYLIK